MTQAEEPRANRAISRAPRTASTFLVSEYQGPLAGAVLQAHAGDHRVTATAYPQPCTSEPAGPPWIADEQIVTFVEGANSLLLDFRQNVDVVIDPRFLDDEPAPLAIRPGSTVRTGRNGEDAAGPNYSLDGWDVKQIGLPPGGSGETFLFSTAGHGLPSSPRGMARTPDGLFVLQAAGGIFDSLWVFQGDGTFVGTWPVEVQVPGDPRSCGTSPTAWTLSMRIISSVPGFSTSRCATPTATTACSPASSS